MIMFDNGMFHLMDNVTQQLKHCKLIIHVLLSIYLLFSTNQGAVRSSTVHCICSSLKIGLKLLLLYYVFLCKLYMFQIMLNDRGIFIGTL